MRVVKWYFQFCMSFPYKRYTATVFNQDLKLPAIIARWENSVNFCPQSPGNFLHYGINFISALLLLDELWLREISHFWCKMGGGGQRILSPRSYIAPGSIIRVFAVSSCLGAKIGAWRCQFEHPGTEASWYFWKPQVLGWAYWSLVL